MCFGIHFFHFSVKSPIMSISQLMESVFGQRWHVFYLFSFCDFLWICEVTPISVVIEDICISVWPHIKHSIVYYWVGRYCKALKRKNYENVGFNYSLWRTHNCAMTCRIYVEATIIKLSLKCLLLSHGMSPYVHCKQTVNISQAHECLETLNLLLDSLEAM